MNRRVTFKTIWIVSERDVSGRRQTFNNQRTLLFGPNATGKSRITKNLFWVFGCEPRNQVQGGWDPDAIVGLDFLFRDESFFVLRDGRRLGLFGPGDRLLFAVDNLSAWAERIASFFGYGLKLQRPHSTKFSQAGLEYLTLPFYMDQEGSWGADWDTYTTLGQFSHWKKEVFEAFVGLWPNAYYDAKRELDEVNGRAGAKRREKDAQTLAFRSVKAVLPRNLPSLDISTFRRELSDLGRKAVNVQREQVKLRGQLLASANLREKIQSEFQIASAAQKELVADMVYLAEIPTKVLECPTCGTIHEKSFHARLSLSQDVESISELVAELNRKLSDVRESESQIRGELKRVEKMLAEMENVTHESRARLRLDEVLAAHSKKTLDIAFRQVDDELEKQLTGLEAEEDKLRASVLKFKDRARQKTIGAYYVDQVASLSNILNVPPAEQLSTPKPGGRAQAGGSGAPRSMLAIHLAMLRTNAEFGDTPMFPFVVDTPQQQGQDFENLARMIEILGRSAGQDHQVILAVETLPPSSDTSTFEVVDFPRGGRALDPAQYGLVVERVKGPLLKIRNHINARSETNEME